MDGDDSTTWSTERYQGGNLGKAGVGLDADARPGVAARAIKIRSPEPGFTVSIYAARSGPPSKLDGWKQIVADRKIDMV